MTTRPNGKPYRPRRPPEVVVCFDEDNVEHEVIVTRTDDKTEAHRLAVSQLKALAQLHEMPLPAPEDGRLAWLRLVPFDPAGYFDQAFIWDEVRGTPCICWDFG